MRKSATGAILSIVLLGSATLTAFDVVTEESATRSVPSWFVNEGDGLRNSGFEQWVDGHPLFWHVSSVGNALVRASDRNAREGKFAIEIQGTFEDFEAGTLVEVDAPLDGAVLLFTIAARAFRKDSMYAFIELGDSGAVAVRSATHPGDGRWHTLEASVVLSEDARSSALHLGFVSSGDGESNTAVFCDRAELQIYEDEAALNRELIPDSKFLVWQGDVPENWRLLAGSSSRVDVEGVIALRLEAVPGSEKGGVQLQRPLSVYGLDAGKIVRVSLDTLSEESKVYCAVYGRVNGEMIRFSHGSESGAAYINIPASDAWQKTRTEYDIPKELEAGSTLLFIGLRTSASKVAFIGEVGAEIVDAE